MSRASAGRPARSLDAPSAFALDARPKPALAARSSPSTNASAPNCRPRRNRQPPPATTESWSRSNPAMWVMRDSNVANAAKESAQTEFPHGLQEFRPRGLWPSDGGRVAGVIGPSVPVGPDSLLGVPALAGYGAQSIRRNRRSPIESSDGAKIKQTVRKLDAGLRTVAERTKCRDFF